MTKSNSVAIFNALPVQVDVLDASLRVSQRLYLLGDQPKAVRDAVSKDGIHAKALKGLFTFPEIQGGNVDWEELDDEDFETIINAEPPPEETTEPTKDDKPLIAKDHVDYNTAVFVEDSVLDLQKKIAVVIDGDPNAQYIATNQRCMTHHISFQSSFDSSHVDHLDMVSFLQECTTKIKGMPTDESYVLTKYSSAVVNTLSSRLTSFVGDNTCLHVVMIPLDVIIPNKTAMQFLLRSDRQSFDLVYESVVERFFINMNSQAFTEYLADNELEFDRDIYKKMITNQTKVIAQLNRMPRSTTDDKHFTVATTAITLRSDSCCVPMMILPKLFNSLNIFDVAGVFYIDLFVTINSRTMQIRKVSKYAAQAINFVEGVSMNIKPLVMHIREYKIRDRLVITLLPHSNFSKLGISIDSFGRVDIIANSSQTIEISNSSFTQEVSSMTKHILEHINTINSAFVSTRKIDTHLPNYKMLKSTSNLIFNQRLDYNHTLKYMLSDLSDTGILEVLPEASNNIRYRTFAVLGGGTEGDKSIQVGSNTKLAVFTLTDLSVEEASFYTDLIGRFVSWRISDIEIKLSTSSNVQAADPVLFKYKSKTNANYSRVCQKRFQPQLASPGDKNAYKYHNFTFDEPQYYKCPTKNNPFLGLLQGYHPSGYCLPCCRKQPQINRDAIISSCISGTAAEDNSKQPIKSSGKLYVIDYPNDLTANSRLIGRLSNVPDFINKMLTKGNTLTIDGLSVQYSEETMDMQMLNILMKYLNKKTGRTIILDMLEYLKDRQTHRKVLSMRNVGYAFDTIEGLVHGLSERFLKQTTLRPTQLRLNWNDIIIDLCICMGIGIALLSDNRLKASDCAHVSSQMEGCSDEPSTTLNSAIKLINLEYLDFTRPILVVLRRVDTEYSKVSNNRRYYYYPISSSQSNDPVVQSIDSNTVDQLQKIKTMTQHQITAVIDRSFNYQALIDSTSSVGKVVTLYHDDDGHIAYADLIAKPSRSLLVSLYRSPNHNDSKVSLKRHVGAKSGAYSGLISDVLKVVQTHNEQQLSDINIADFQTYLTYNPKRLRTNQHITLPITNRGLLKVDRFIVYGNSVVGTRVSVVMEKTILHTIVFYHKATPLDEAHKILLSAQKNILKLIESKPTKDSATAIAIAPIDLVHRSNNVVYRTKAVEPFTKYFCEYLIDPMLLIDSTPNPSNYPPSNALDTARYMSNIYKMTINALVTYWKDTHPTKLIQALTHLIEQAKPDALRLLSNNLIEDWIDQLTNTFADHYHANVIGAEVREFATYIHNSVRNKNKSTIINTLTDPSVSINDIELHNLAYARKDQIVKMVHDAADKCLIQTGAVPTIDPKDSENIFMQYRDKSGKLQVLKSIYDELLSLVVADLCNPFRREYVLDNCMISSFVNSVKIKSHIDELIYMQEL